MRSQLVIALGAACLVESRAVAAQDSLPSWNDGDAKKGIVAALAGSGARFALFVHHDDATREYAYDRADTLQQFNKGWDEAIAKGWIVVSMKNDWKVIYPSRR